MLKKHVQQEPFRQFSLNWLPALLAIIFIYFVPPVGIAIIVAYFTAPILTALRTVSRLPLTIATIFVMLSIIFIASTFLFIALHGLMDTIPLVETQLAHYTKSTNSTGKIFVFLDEKFIEYGHALLEYAISFTTTLFQKIFSLFIFIVAYFFALRESGKNRFWFLIYFPASMKKPAKRIFTKSGELIGTFFFVEARLFLLTFIVLSIGFTILGFNSPIGSAFLVSLIDSLPLFGIGLFLIPMAIFYLYSKQLFVGISLILLYIFVITTRQMAESYMWASAFRVKPIHAFFITVCSFYLFGLPGILLTPFLLFAALKLKKHPSFTG
ncbi:AI-2E family transporter [Sporosarcina oncorhynchi]|uniref:AI-2E family transporter n=1 Tax=Sporosarcina oncorhynchi TaxID=3056444 RepID=A0ABZ0L8L0_9BACL|nr:AI-2E family transporter [Sporosarcina sp. T2O-4]WOV88607.1 AI-2E family transporter [Sporosarcina sp. T2O-4]